MKNLKNNNILFTQDINTDEKNNIITNIYRYFYSLFKLKRDIKSFLKYFQVFLETIQFISYIFSQNHFNSWKLDKKKLKTINNIVSAFRLSTLMQFVEYKIYSIILYFILVIIFLFCLIVILQILFIDSTSKKYNFFLLLIRSLVDIIAIIFYLPFTEILLLPVRCSEGKVKDIKNGETCWVNYHYLNVVLGIIGSILLFIWSVFMINFSFYPFQSDKSTIRTNSNNVILAIMMKLILVLQYLLISNEYVSLTILLLTSIILFFNCYFNQTYNIKELEIAITMKNLLIIWSYFVLLLSKIFQNYEVNGFIYLLIYGYPLNIYLSIIICREKEYFEICFSENINNPKNFIKKALINIKLINSFIKINKNVRNGNENMEQKNIILLKGNIEFHNMACTNSDCPLNKFINNEGNFNIQRQSLLNYMNIFFNRGFKKFPNNIYLIILYIHFNFINRFNLNSVKTNFLKLKAINCGIKERFIIFCMEQNIKDSNNRGNNYDDSDNQEEINEQKYQKLKYLIESSIKLYAEFWGIFSTNVTSIINTTKLYSLGKKLNIYLNEINNLWDNELKNKKISNECQNIAQLYSKFLLEILWDRKKSREVSKKINDENIRSHLNETKKDKEGKNKNMNIESLLDNQDYLLFCDSDEKGNSKIIQCSSSFSQILGYQKYDMVGKPFEMIFPNILIEENLKYLEECIKSLHNKENDQKDMYQESDSNKNRKFIMIKNKMGYIIPFYAYFNILDDNDYSDSFLVKIKFEKRESKSEYSYYVLTTHDLIIENISSSAIHLGLTLDLLKKYMVKMDILIRTDNDKVLNIYDNLDKFEDEPKSITWTFPNLIYPKENNRQVKGEDIDDLIRKSMKKHFYLTIERIKNNNINNRAFAFKFTEVPLKRRNKKSNDNKYIPKCDKNLIMFDILNLCYIRTLIVLKKTGLRNLRNMEVEETENPKVDMTASAIKKNKKRKKSSMALEENESSDDSLKKKNDNLLTKEKIAELQVNCCSEIKEFIFSLPVYGKDIALERFRPNGDKYSASKITEPSIKIQVINFSKRIEEKMHLYSNVKTSKNKNLIHGANHIENQDDSSNTNNYLFSTGSDKKSSSSIEISKQPSDYHREEINKVLVSESSSSLSNIFKTNSVNYIKIIIALAFFITFLFLVLEFIITYRQMNKLKKKNNYLYNSYRAMTNILYTKYYVTEGVLANTLNIEYVPVIYNMDITHFINDVVEELTECRNKFTELFSIFTSNDLCQEYNNFMKITKINIATLTVNKHENLEILFNNALSRVPASLNDLIANPYSIKMDNRDTYELMYNLINEYYMNWQKVINILFNDSIKATKLRLSLKFFIVLYFIISAIFFVILFFLLSKLSLDREKPINLFLTLKKNVFENLKTSAENFSNKLLNKFFGNEENEEESQQYYQANIQPNDINIVKFKAANEYNYSVIKAFSFIQIIIIILVFLFLYLLYFVLKYFLFRQKMANIYNYILLLDKTSAAQTDYILSLDIFKSYLYNKSIPILNQKDTKALFIENFINVSNKFEDSIIINSKRDSFLDGKYWQKYGKYLYGDFRELMDKVFYEEHKNMLDTTKNGLKSVQIRFCEIIRYYTIKYCNFNTLYDIVEDDISFILKEKEYKLYEISILVQLIMKTWYENVLKLMMNSFFEYIDETNLNYIIFLICLIILAILYYSIIWKTYEEKLNILLKGSSDLINLIPQEIKNLIIEKLNE